MVISMTEPTRRIVLTPEMCALIKVIVGVNTMPSFNIGLSSTCAAALLLEMLTIVTGEGFDDPEIPSEDWVNESREALVEAGLLLDARHRSVEVVYQPDGHECQHRIDRYCADLDFLFCLTDILGSDEMKALADLSRCKREAIRLGSWSRDRDKDELLWLIGEVMPEHFESASRARTLVNAMRRTWIMVGRRRARVSNALCPGVRERSNHPPYRIY